MIKINGLTTAVCPFCKKFIRTDIKILKCVNAATESDSLKKLLSGKANLIRCGECGKSFYYEHLCVVYNTYKKYAVFCLAGGDTSALPTEKSAFYSIFNMPDFKFRFVEEFINLIEKVKIFEYNLDDRVFEMIKYKHICLPKKMNEKSKIILTNTRDDVMEFTVFDDFDLPVSVHRAGIDTYYKESSLLKKEVNPGSRINWVNIDFNWARENLTTQGAYYD